MKDCDDILKESDIYFRYNSKSDKMKPADLLLLLNEIKNSNNNQQSRKNDIKPIFQKRGGTRGNNEVSEKFENIGERAFVKSIEELEGNNLYINFRESIIDKGGKWVLSGRVKDPTKINTNTYHFKLIFEDVDSNKYYQIFTAPNKNNEVNLPVAI